MSTPEGKVKARVDAILSKFTNVIVNPMTKGYGKSGAADKLTCIGGLFVAIETKSVHATGQKKYPTKLQQRFLANVMRSGGCVAVINETNVHYLETWLGDLTDPNCNVRKFILFEGCPHPYSAEQAQEVTIE